MPEDVPTALVEVSGDGEGALVCERLRAHGIRCAVELIPNRWSSAARVGRPAGDVLAVLVNESDLERATAVLAEHERAVGGHRVSICESVPIGGEPSGLGPGYQAVCECDWTGPLRGTSKEAFADAGEHSKHVVPEIVRAPSG